MNQHLLVKMRHPGALHFDKFQAHVTIQAKRMLWLQRMLWVIPAIGALIWHIFPAQLNDSELIRGSLIKTKYYDEV